MKTTKEVILGTVEELVASFMFYDRKHDERLGRGEIEIAIASGKITAEEIVEEFRKHLTEGLAHGRTLTSR